MRSPLPGRRGGNRGTRGRAGRRPQTPCSRPAHRSGYRSGWASAASWTGAGSPPGHRDPGHRLGDRLHTGTQAGWQASHRTQAGWQALHRTQTGWQASHRDTGWVTGFTQGCMDWLVTGSQPAHRDTGVYVWLVTQTRVWMDWLVTHRHVCMDWICACTIIVLHRYVNQLFDWPERMQLLIDL